MLDYESQRKLILVFTLATVLTIFLTIVALIFIWVPDDNKDDDVFEVGKVTIQTVQQADVVKKYYEDLYVMFLNNDIDAIYNLLGSDYLEYNGLDKQKVIDNLREKNVLSRGLELVQYRTYSMQEYSNVYELDLKVKDEAYIINIVLREYSPNNYTIALDKFIDYSKPTYTSTVDSVRLDIKKIIRYTNSVEYECRVTNNYNSGIKINTGATASPVLLVNSQEKSKTPIMSTLSTAELDLEPGEYRDFNVVFKIEDSRDYLLYNKLIIKNVEFTNLQGTINLEYNLH